MEYDQLILTKYSHKIGRTKIIKGRHSLVIVKFFLQVQQIPLFFANQSLILLAGKL